MHFVLGNFGSGKTQSIIKEVFTLLQQQQKVLIIVPSRQHKDNLLKELLKQQQGIIGTPILTLGEFQRTLIEKIFPIPNQRPQDLTNFSKFLIISSICTQLTSQFKVFHKIQERPELIKMIYRLINILRDKDINILDSSLELQDKIHDIQLILDHYESYLTKNRITDPKLQIELICQHLHLLQQDDLPNHIYIDGFIDYTATQFKLISQTAKHCIDQKKQVTITLTDSPHILSQQSIEHFKQSFPQAKVIQLTNSSASTMLADAFLKEEPYTTEQLKFIEIQAFGKSKEIEYIVNQIKKLCITNNYSLEDIILITTKQDQYSSILSSTLRKAGIPFSFGKDDKLAQNPLIIFIKRLLKLMTKNLTHESLEFLAQSNYIKQEFQLLWGSVAIQLPFTIDGKTNVWKQAFQQQKEFLIQQEDNENINESLVSLENLENSIINLCEQLYKIDTYNKYPIQDIIQQIINLIEFLGIQEKLATSTPLIKHKKIIEESIAKDYSALLKLKEILIELQKSLEDIGHQNITLQNFLFFFTIITEETRYRSEIPKKNLLRILTPNDTRGIFAKATFILGLNEGEFPSPPKLELFDNFERSQLNGISKKILGKPLWDTELDYFSEQKLLFATALSRSLEKIFFSRTPINEKGTYFNSSHFLQRILNKNISYERIPYTTSTNSENPAIFHKKHEANEYFETSQLIFIKKEQHTSAILSYEYSQKINTGNTLLDKGELPSEDILSYFGYIPEVTTLTSRYSGNNISISPTRLEKIGRCRYQGLWQGYWKFKPYKLPSYKPEAADYGNLYHKVLEQYLIKNSNNDYDDMLLQEILQYNILISQQSILFRLDYHYIYLILQNFLKNIEPQLKAQQEVKFLELSSGEGELSNQQITLNNTQNLTIYSRIDRVDYNTINNSYSIIDYKKSGIDTYKKYQKTPFNLFQGFLYSELLRINHKTPVQDISYIFLEKSNIFQEYPNITSKSRLYQNIGEYQDFKLTEISRLIELISKGNFSPYTLDQDIGDRLKEKFVEKFGEKFEREHSTKCAYCDLKKMCLRKRKKLSTY